MGSKKESVILPQENISASDVERYGYCPMSWWLKRQGAHEDEDDRLKSGTEKHKAIGNDLSKIKKHEEMKKQYDINIGIFAFVAIMLAISVLPPERDAQAARLASGWKKASATKSNGVL